PLRSRARRWSSAALAERNPNWAAISARVGGRPECWMECRMMSRIWDCRAVSFRAMSRYWMETQPILCPKRFLKASAAREENLPAPRALPGMAIGSLDHAGDRFGHVVDIATVQRRHADAAAAHGIDAEILAQAVDVGLGEARVGEHAALRLDEAEVLVHALSLDLFDQLVAHGADAIAHAGQFLGPLRVQFGRVQYGRDQGTAMGGRIGVVGADDALQLAEHAGAFLVAAG